MENKALNKFENPARLSELNPSETLKKAGFKENMILCDIGAGTGIFSFPAADISNNKIFALDISDGMIEILRNKILSSNVNNVMPVKVESEILPVEDGKCDMALMVTVMHEIENKSAMLKEIKRILKEEGRFLVIEFHKRKTPMGPPPDHRISEEYLISICSEEKFEMKEKFDLGENFYGIIFENGISN